MNSNDNLNASPSPVEEGVIMGASNDDQDNHEPIEEMSYREAISIVCDLAQQNMLDPEHCDAELKSEALRQQAAMEIMRSAGCEIWIYYTGGPP